jgi:hypothetical protein
VKQFTAFLICAVIFTVAAHAEHPLGMPAMVFCSAFQRKASVKWPMRYQDFIKLTDGDGMPGGTPDLRHWDGLKSSYLSVILHSVGTVTVVKGGLITCPNGNLLTFGNW